ncbi:MAG TPA: hypothetical protein VK464_03600 [Symbiobacteriaceae bacterium]|nr:hypothetical protein [Symbiobacteriaceae bacterium]
MEEQRAPAVAGAHSVAYMLVEVPPLNGPHTSGGMGGQPPNAGDTRHSCGITMPKEGTSSFATAVLCTTTHS